MKLIFPPATPAPLPERALPPPRKPVPIGVPVYPPTDQGIVRADPEWVMDTQDDLIRRIRLLAGTDDCTYEDRYLSVIRRLAAYIQLLPASETDAHAGPGGLFRLSLELAFFSAQAAEAVVFAGRATSEDRRREEPRWRYAAFLAGMCCELHRCITHMRVVDVQGRVWPAFNVGLTDWLEEGETDRYYVRWAQGMVGSMATTGLLIHKIVESTNLQYLQDGSAKIVPVLMDTVTGVRSHEKAALPELIDQIREKVMLRDKCVQPANYGKASVGSHLEPHLLDAMRQLVKSGKWTINERKGRLWYSKAGLYLVWRLAAKEILDLLAKGSVSGVPQDAQTLLEILLAAKVFAPDRDGSPYWMIIPPGEKSELAAIKFANPMILFGTTLDEILPVDSLDGSLVTENQKTGVAPASAAEDRKPATAVSEGGTETKSAPAETMTAAPIEPGAAIPEVEETDNSAKMPGAVAGTLRPATMEVLNLLLNEHLTNKAKDRMSAVDHGFAICIEHLAGFGVALEDILKHLHEGGWLYSPPEKPNKKVHQVVLNNRKRDVVIIKASLARDGGFIK